MQIAEEPQMSDPKAMERIAPASELTELLTELGWTVPHLAWLLDVQDRSVQRWMSGQNTIPPTLLAWLREWRAFHQQHPLPDDWQTVNR